MHNTEQNQGFMGKRTEKKKKSLTVMDFFCGAGGFSEGFRSAGFEIVHGVEKGKAAVATFNCNFGLSIKPQDILYYEGPVERIEELPDTDVIIGSPPCVSFSFSNKLGNADKTMGIRLMNAYLRIIAVKKHKSQSTLKAWYLENVPNSLKFLPDSFTFADLDLIEWCAKNAIDPQSVAIEIKKNAIIVDAADYGTPQSRKRLFVHEYMLQKNSGLSSLPDKVSRKLTVGEIRSKLPSPTCKSSSREITDPLYSAIKIPLREVTDHFYESGIYAQHWLESRYLKLNHPYMGRMAFPEHTDRPSRTVMASLSFCSREAHFYKSEWNRTGDGEYRLPTVREAATLMGFPITYQFIGNTAATKWRLVGNAVCPLLAQAFGKQLIKKLGYDLRNRARRNLPLTLDKLPNLNTFEPADYNNPPKRMLNARFRRHPFKKANIAVTLSNYDLTKNGQTDGAWRCYVTYGSGKDYKLQLIGTDQLPRIRSIIERETREGKSFIHHITNGFSEKIPPYEMMQKLHEDQKQNAGYLSPQRLIEATGTAIGNFIKQDDKIEIGKDLLIREVIPKSQLFALFTVCHIVSTAEAKGEEHERRIKNTGS